MRQILTVSLLALAVTAVSATTTAAVALAPLLAAGAVDSAAAARQAASMTGGRVVDVRTTYRDGLAVYEVKVVLDDGRVKIVSIAGAEQGSGEH